MTYIHTVVEIQFTKASDKVLHYAKYKLKKLVLILFNLTFQYVQILE